MRILQKYIGIKERRLAWDEGNRQTAVCDNCYVSAFLYVTGLDGRVTQHVEYIPFGEVFVERRNDSWNTPYLFNAKELDEETGLYYYGARYYDPRLAVWLSPDPMEEKYPSISSYCYGANNPIGVTDPDGMVLKVVSGEALKILSLTLHPSDRKYLQVNSYGYVDADLLNMGVAISKTESRNLSSLSQIVNNSRTVVFYGTVPEYEYKNSTTGEIEKFNFQPIEIVNIYRDLMEAFTGTEQLKEYYSKSLLSMGILDEFESRGVFGITLQAPDLTSEFPTLQISTSQYTEVYINAKILSILQKAKTTAHELYGHALFGLKGLDSRHGGSSGNMQDNRQLETQINHAENETLKYNH